MSRALSLSTAVPLFGQTVALLNHIFPPPRNFAVRLREGTELSAAGGPPFTLVLKYPGALRRIARLPIGRSLREAFIYGDFDIEGHIFSAISLIDVLTTRSFSPDEITSLIREGFARSKTGPIQP